MGLSLFTPLSLRRPLRIKSWVHALHVAIINVGYTKTARPPRPVLFPPKIFVCRSVGGAAKHGRARLYDEFLHWATTIHDGIFNVNGSDGASSYFPGSGITVRTSKHGNIGILVFHRKTRHTCWKRALDSVKFFMGLVCTYSLQPCVGWSKHADGKRVTKEIIGDDDSVIERVSPAELQKSLLGKRVVAEKG